MTRQASEDLSAPFKRPIEPERRCAHPGCAGGGDYRAPKSRDNLTDYYWFCLDHVRAYNRAWDFFADMTEDEIEFQRRFDTVWQRPSWPLGRFGERASKGFGFGSRDPFGFFAEEEGEPPPPRPRTEAQKALALLDLHEPVTFADVKARYKTLVKRLHPDANGGDRDAEEKLKEINQAYAALKTSFA